MLQGVYGAAVAMQGAERQHEVIARNLAHAQSPGYRRALVLQGTFDDSLQESAEQFAARSSTGTRGMKSSTDFSDGVLEITGRQFDVAIQGQGFFVVKDGNNLLYTRNGSFTIDAAGKLVTRDGREVQGAGGPIQFEVENGIGAVTIDSGGRIVMNDIELGRIKIASFEEPDKLVNVGTTLFQDPEGTAQDLEQFHLEQGQLEGSNVHPVLELVDMIAVQRRYDAAARTLRALLRTLEQRINLQGGT